MGSDYPDSADEVLALGRRIAQRKPDSHKGDYGRLLLVGGSPSMSGAIVLCGRAALRSGAGLVTLAVPQTVHAIVAAHEPAYMVRPMAADSFGCWSRRATDAVRAEWTDEPSFQSLACGPGMTRGAGTQHLARAVYRQLRRPAVLDADALHAVAASPQMIGSAKGPRILTPHPGEFRALVHAPEMPLDECRDAAVELAARDPHMIVVLKGHRTLVTDGDRTFTNVTGNPGMATGGSGDVLTGVASAVLAQQPEDPFLATCLAVFVHGLAGDLAAAERGQVGMTAGDLVEFLPAAWQALAETP